VAGPGVLAGGTLPVGSWWVHAYWGGGGGLGLAGGPFAVGGGGVLACWGGGG